MDIKEEQVFAIIGRLYMELVIARSQMEQVTAVLQAEADKQKSAKEE